MAYAHATHGFLGVRPRTEYVCVGVPPEKEVAPEPRENGATLAAIARILRGAFATTGGPTGKGFRSRPAPGTPAPGR